MEKRERDRITVLYCWKRERKKEINRIVSRQRRDVWLGVCFMANRVRILGA